MRKTYKTVKDITTKSIDKYIDDNNERVRVLWGYLDTFLDSEQTKFTTGVKRIFIEDAITNKVAGYEAAIMWLNELKNVGEISNVLIKLRMDILKSLESV